MLISGLHQYPSITWAGPLLFLTAWLVIRPAGEAWDLGWISEPSIQLICREKCCSEIWGSEEDPHLRFETTLILLLDCDHCLQTEKSNSLVLLGRALSWVFILVTNTHYAPGTFSPSLLGSKITPSGESQQKLLQLTLKLKSRLCVKLLWDRNPQCQALKDK